jgi:hypothetical protein
MAVATSAATAQNIQEGKYAPSTSWDCAPIPLWAAIALTHMKLM